MFETTTGGEPVVFRASLLQWFKAGFAFTCGAMLASFIAWIIAVQVYLRVITALMLRFANSR